MLRAVRAEYRAGGWVGLSFVEGVAFYFWFDDEQACLSAMAGAAHAAVPSGLWIEDKRGSKNSKPRHNGQRLRKPRKNRVTVP